MQPVARELRPALPVLNSALERGIPVTDRSVGFYGRLQPALVSLRDLMEDPATGIALRGLTANSTTLAPQLRYLGPYQTVCNYWTYFFTFLGEHVSQNGPYGYSQRALDQEHRPAGEQPEHHGLGAAGERRGLPRAEPPARRSRPPPRDPLQRRDRRVRERGLRERPARLSAQAGALQRAGPRHRHRPAHPGEPGPDLHRASRGCRAGQTFTREPETGGVHAP